MMTKEEIIKKFVEDNVYFFENGDYAYKDEKGIRHLIRDGKEICKGQAVLSFSNGNFVYKDKNGIVHLFNKNHQKIKEI